MPITIMMDRTGRVVVPRAVRERFGLTGSQSHAMELVEAPEGIVLRPVGAEVPVSRDASGWVVFHSDTDGLTREVIDPAALVESVRERRTRHATGE